MHHVSPVSVRNAVILFILINTVLIVATRFLPFIDLPNHLAESTIYKYYNEAGNTLAQYYQPTPWYFPNTFHTVFCSLFPTVEIGNKVFHIVYIMLLQVSMFLVIRELGGNLWYGFLGALFTYNYNVSFGFVGYAMSIPITLLLFYTILRDIRYDKLVTKMIIAALLILLFLTHAQAALFGLVVYACMMLYAYHRSFLKLLVRGIFVPLPLVILIFAWWFTREAVKEESTAGFLTQYYTTRFLPTLPDRVRLAVLDNFQLQPGTTGIIIAACFFLSILVPLLYFKVWQRVSKNIFLQKEMVYAAILFICNVGCYLVLPDELPGQSPLYQRFCTMVILSFIIFASVMLRGVTSNYLRYFSIAVVTVYTIFWTEYIVSFNRMNGNFTPAFFSNTDADARLAGLIYDNNYRGRKVYIHYPNYFIIWKQGISASKIIDYRFGVVRRAVPEAKLPFYHEYIGEPYKPRPVPQYGDLEYILVRGDGPLDTDINLTNYAVIKEERPWRLLERRDKPGRHVMAP